jgi:hypothetical protein
MLKVFRYLIACSLMMTAPASAQENRVWPERIFVTIDVPFQVLNNHFSESVSFGDTLRKTENVTFAAAYEPIRGALVEAGAGVRLFDRLGVGVTASWLRHVDSASFDLQVPDPLVANRPLDLPGSVTGLRRNEVGIHIQALYALALGNKARMLLGGGPSVFDTNQHLVRSIEFDTLPGFTSLQFNQAIITEVTRTVVGFNVSANVMWPLASHLGVGAVTRYARATATLDPGSASGVSRTIELHPGGLQIGGGVRLLF